MIDTCAGEFASYIPYFYSSYEEENESIVSDKPKIIVLGSGQFELDKELNLIIQLFMLFGPSRRWAMKQL